VVIIKNGLLIATTALGWGGMGLLGSGSWCVCSGRPLNERVIAQAQTQLQGSSNLPHTLTRLLPVYGYTASPHTWVDTNGQTVEA